MSIIDFFHNTPVFATIIALAYLALWGAFTYMLIQMFKK